MSNESVQVEKVNGNAVITQVGGHIYGDIVAGNKTVIQQIIRQARQIVTAPYKFLNSYDISDRDIFFGRDAVIEELVGKMPRYKTLVINGRSGSGKTSLINAGLIPRLAGNGYQFLSFRDYSDPMRQLREHVAQNDLFKAYTDQTNSLTQFLKTVTRRQPPQHVALIFDQFECFFLNVPDAARVQFIHEIKACLDSDLSGEELDIVFALREEFFGQFAREFGASIPTFLKETDLFNLEPLCRAEAREAILKPLERIALKIGYDADFVDAVLLPGLMGESSGGLAIDPPHLQIVCNQLYDKAKERYAAKLERGGVVEIDRGLYDDLQGTTGILKNYLDDRIAKIVPQIAGGQAVLRAMLKTMVETTGTRKFVALSEAQRELADVAPAVVADGLRLLREERIIEMRGEDETRRYSLSHEVMVARVTEWFDEREFEQKKAEETLKRGLQEWASSQTLLHENQVQHIRRWARTDDLTAQAEALLTTSQRAYEEQQRKEAEQERRIRRNRTAFQMALGLGLVIALVLTTLAFWQRNLAEEQRQQAVQQKELALKAIDSLTYDLVDELAKLPRTAPIVARILESNVVLLDRIYALDPDTPRAQREKGSNLSRAGDVWLLLGNTDKALRAYQQSLEICQRLAAADPTNTQAQYDLSISYERQGNVQLQLGNTQNALEAYQQLLNTIQPLVISDPNNTQVQLELSIAYENLGNVQLQLGDTLAALRAYQQGSEIRQMLATADPANTQTQRGLSISYSKIGDMQLQLGDTQAALSAYQQSLETSQRLAAADHANTEAQRDLSISYSKIGDVEMKLGDMQAALTAYQQSLEIHQRLAAADPANTQAQRDLSVSYVKLGDVQLQLGDTSAALRAYQQSLEISQRLAAADPANTQAQRDLSVSYNKLGDVHLQLGDTQVALSAYQQSLAIDLRLAAANPANTQAQRDLSNSYGKLGDVHLQLGDTQTALSAYQQSLEIRQRFAVADPANTQAQRDLFISYSKLGDIQVKLGDVQAALKSYQQVLEINQRLAATDPTNTHAQRDLSISYSNLGGVQLQLDDTPAALNSYQQSLEIRQRLAAADPINIQAQCDLLISFYKLGQIKEQSNQPQEALEWYQQALSIAERLAQDRANAQAQNDLKIVQDAVKALQDAAAKQ